MSAKDGAQTTKLSVDDSSEAWYSRDDVKRLYVKSDDGVPVVNGSKTTPRLKASL